MHIENRSLFHFSLDWSRRNVFLKESWYSKLLFVETSKSRQTLIHIICEVYLMLEPPYVRNNKLKTKERIHVTLFCEKEKIK